MFYPDIFRRDKYKIANHGGYYSYSAYKSEIEEDCKNRCVYCDISLPEIGYEGMQLDHFKPKKLPDVDKNNPFNLVLSCPKCNRTKSDYWPIVDSDIALPDPFSANRKNNYLISEKGLISGKNCNNTQFKIELLVLNRPARIQLRRARFTKKRRKTLMEQVIGKIQELYQKTQEIEKEEIEAEILQLKNILIEIHSIYD